MGRMNEFAHVCRTRRPPLIPRVQTNRKDRAEELLESLGLNPPRERVRDLFSRIKEDDSLDRREKNTLIRHLTESYIAIIGEKVCASDYRTLKSEAKLLAEMTRRSFIHMAFRLLKIRDEELYREDGYPDFKSFLDGEICLSRSTVYNYIDIVTYFGVQPVGQESDVEYSKLLPLLPLLKSDNPAIPKEELKAVFVAEARVKGREELKRLANRYKARYGLTKPKCSSVVKFLSKVRKQLPSELDEEDRRAVRDMIRYLTRLVGS